ncbi:MAG: CxxxxCH/CxxCH domain-containing protein [Geobacteraceae bacterium]|nr:CxxxxCH/CxxCH domain-containing protein [Geobacteraceae bacterium]
MLILLSCCLLSLVAVVAGSGTAYAALTCASCHSMPPSDSGVRSPSTGGFQGDHQTHNPATAQPSDCSKCHDVTGYTSSHRNGIIQLIPNINASPATGAYNVGGTPVTFKNQTSLPILGSCSNVNCHFEKTTPNWGSPYLGARSDVVCSTCHDSVPTTNAHSTHTTYLAANGGVLASATCNSCHVTNYGDASHALQVGRPINVALATGKYSTAMKASYLPSQQSGRTAGDCSNLYCHSDGKGNFVKPNWGTPSTGACGTCHGNPPSSSGSTEASPFNPHAAAAFGTYVNTCANCHVYTDVNGPTHINNSIDKQALLITEPHKSNKTFSGYSASYITSKSVCADCHNSSNANNQTIRQEWKQTAHAAVGDNAFRSSDFKTQASSSNCPRCHTTTGFVKFSSARAGGSWGVATDYTKEVITCRACHSDIATGTVRTMTPVKPFANYTAFQNANFGTSNVCADCHSGRDAANRRIAVMSNFSIALSYGSHYLPAAGTVQGVTGYAFPGRSYSLTDNSHGKVGTLNANSTGTDGPCATCHMTATDKHSFAAITKDVSGAVATIKTNICNSCHSTSLPAATLDAKRLSFNNAMDVLKATLADKGFVWNSTTLTFNTTAGGTIIKWGLKTGDQASRNKYGAATNYRLFIAEPGAYVHNPEYARQLIVDSIDAVYNNGTVTGDITAAVADLLGRGKITQAQSDSLVTYKTATASCNGCHGYPPAGANETSLFLPHSPTAFSSTYVNTCANCHVYTTASSATHMNGSIDKQALLITEPHKSNKTFSGYSASYITSKSVCADCHNSSNANNQTIRQEWKQTAHAAVGDNAFRSSDFKTQASSSNCPRCHTTTGFVKFSSARAGGSWGVATDYTKEVITCRACHSDIATGTVRTMTPVKPFANYTAFQNANFGTSNVCADCHSGRDAANRRIAVMSNFSIALSYGSHYLPAAGTVQGVTGYAFPGRSYSLTDNSHGKVGTLNANSTGTDGPCATCHMTATDKHSFAAITKDVSGAVATIKTNICNSCHSTSLPAATLDAKRLSFNNAMDVLKATLADKGFVWNSTTLTFNTTAGGTIIKWGLKTGDQASRNKYGAATNYRLFIAEPGAYVHNPEYARQLIVDSIDAVYNNGTVTGDITAAVADLLGRGKITQAQSDSLVTYKNPEASCTACHGNPPSTPTHIGIVAGTCTNCHIFTGVNGPTHNNGVVDLNLDGASCNACHGYPPAPRVTEAPLTFGVQGQWSSARFEDYSGGGGAHLVAGHLLGSVKPSDGWTPCLTCHSGGASTHSRVLPVRNHVENVKVIVDPKFSFNNATLPVYTTARLTSGGTNQTGNCYNASCHFRPSPKWSLER